MNESSLGERLRYRFDVWMSGGTIALMGLLGLATAAFVVVLGVATWIVLALIPDDAAPDPEQGPFDFVWGALMRTLDPGTMGADQGWMFRILMLVVTIGGLLVVASLIGIVSGAFDSRIEMLRKGRSRVLEKDHTLILGWNSKIFSIVQELAVANESRGRSHIVIMAERDKVEMEDLIRGMPVDLGKTSVICRTGDPKSLQDLEIGNPRMARSIILLGPEDSDDPDADVIKAALALTHSPTHSGAKYHIVGELTDAEHLEVAHLVGGDEAHWIVGHELIGRITVQTSRQSGLSSVYQDLLDFSGDEIYFTEQPELFGSTFLDAQLSFENCTAIGLVVGDEVQLNPTADTVINHGDQVIVIAADDSLIRLTKRRTAVAPSLTRQPRARTSERTLVLGASPRLASMLTELDSYVVPGSVICIVADIDQQELPELQNLELQWVRADPTRRSVLESLDPVSFDHILVLADTSKVSAGRADNRTLVVLLQLRDLARASGVDLNIVGEVLDDNNRELAEVTEADDFIVSDKLVALALAQVSENKQLADVFAQLFANTGSEIYLNPAEDYVELGVEIDMAVLCAAAQQRGQTALGYREVRHARSAAERFGLRVNPPTGDSFTLATGDKVIVLSAV